MGSDIHRAVQHQNEIINKMTKLIIISTIVALVTSVYGSDKYRSPYLGEDGSNPQKIQDDLPIGSGDDPSINFYNDRYLIKPGIQIESFFNDQFSRAL